MRRKPNRSARLGIRKVIVPNLSGLSRSQAKTLLQAAGLTWSESSSSVQNINLNDMVEGQSISSGTTVSIGNSISFSYYLYVAPPPPPPPIIATPPPIIAVPPPIIAVPPPIIAVPPPIIAAPVSDCVDDDAGFCINIDANGYGDGYNYQYSPSGRFTCPPRFYGRTFCGVPTPPPPPIISTPPPIIATPPPIIATPPPIIATPPPIIAAPPPPPPIFSKSVSVSTLVRTPTGLVRAENLNVGDVLLSADLEGFPYNPGEGVTEEALAWTTNNPNLNIVHTTIVEIARRTATKAVIVNGDIFSQWHWILVKRNNITQFVRCEEIIEGTDYIFDAESNLWEIVDLFEVINITHETISINCEPYDMFFTEKMLTHDSFSI